MSLFVSFAWTIKPFLANAKDMTRRYWKTVHAERFAPDMIVNAFDKLPYAHGKKIGEIKITKKPYQQRTGLMTELDYKREGLLWMEQNNISIHGEKPRTFFEDWKKKDDLVWVLEFERIE